MSFPGSSSFQFSFHTKYWYYNTSSLQLPCLPHHLFHPGQLKPLFNTTLIMFFIGFPILSYLMRPHAIIIGYPKPNAKASQSNILLYTNHNTLSVKHATNQKAKPLRATSLSKLCNTVNNNSIFNTTCAEFSTKWKVFVHFHNSNSAYNHPYN